MTYKNLQTIIKFVNNLDINLTCYLLSEFYEILTKSKIEKKKTTLCTIYNTLISQVKTSIYYSFCSCFNWSNKNDNPNLANSAIFSLLSVIPVWKLEQASPFGPVNPI